jgi:hypothetical protein
MTSFYGPNAAFYSTGPGSAKDLVKRIDDMSGGRLKIQFFGAGELIPAAEGFDAVSSGTVEMNYANSYFWTGKSFAAQYFTAVPFGLNFQGFNGWYFDGGGLELWREVYDRFNLVPDPVRQHRRADDRLVPQADREVEDLKGSRCASRVLRARLSRTRRRLAPDRARRDLSLARARRDRRGGIRRPLSRPPARPAQGRRNTTTPPAGTRWRRPANSPSTRQVESCPPTSRRSSRTPARPATRISEAWCQKNNAEAMEDLVKNHGVIAHRCPTRGGSAASRPTRFSPRRWRRIPVTKKVHDSYMAYKAKYDAWADLSETVYHNKIRKAS